MKNSDVTTDELAFNLPMSDYFNVTYDSRRRTLDDNYEGFSWAAYEFGQKECGEEPYLYQSYDVFQASRLQQNYKFVTHVNTTGQDSTVFAP